MLVLGVSNFSKILEKYLFFALLSVYLNFAANNQLVACWENYCHFFNTRIKFVFLANEFIQGSSPSSQILVLWGLHIFRTFKPVRMFKKKLKFGHQRRHNVVCSPNQKYPSLTEYFEHLLGSNEKWSFHNATGNALSNWQMLFDGDSFDGMKDKLQILVPY